MNSKKEFSFFLYCSKPQSHSCLFGSSMAKALGEWFKANWQCDDWARCGKERWASTRQPTGWEFRGRSGCLASALNRGRLDESQTQRGLSDVQCRHQSLERENRAKAQVWRTEEKRIANFACWLHPVYYHWKTLWGASLLSPSWN